MDSEPMKWSKDRTTLGDSGYQTVPEKLPQRTNTTTCFLDSERQKALAISKALPLRFDELFDSQPVPCIHVYIRRRQKPHDKMLAFALAADVCIRMINQLEADGFFDQVPAGIRFEVYGFHFDNEAFLEEVQRHSIQEREHRTLVSSYYELQRKEAALREGPPQHSEQVIRFSQSCLKRDISVTSEEVRQDVLSRTITQSDATWQLLHHEQTRAQNRVQANANSAANLSSNQTTPASFSTTIVKKRIDDLLSNEVMRKWHHPLDHFLEPVVPASFYVAGRQPFNMATIIIDSVNITRNDIYLFRFDPGRGGGGKASSERDHSLQKLSMQPVKLVRRTQGQQEQRFSQAIFDLLEGFYLEEQTGTLHSPVTDNTTSDEAVGDSQHDDISDERPDGAC